MRWYAPARLDKAANLLTERVLRAADATLIHSTSTGPARHLAALYRTLSIRRDKISHTPPYEVEFDHAHTAPPAVRAAL